MSIIGFKRRIAMLLILSALGVCPFASAQDQLIYTYCSTSGSYLCGTDPAAPDEFAVVYGPRPSNFYGSSISADGRVVAYQPTRSTELLLSNVDGSAARRVHDPGVTVSKLALSPDGSRLAYTMFTDGVKSLHVVNVETGESSVLLEPAPASAFQTGHPAWSPDGSQLLFQVWDEGLYTMITDGTGTPRQVTSTPQSVYDLYADWHPDGGRIAIVRSDIPRETIEIVVVDVDTESPPQTVYSRASELNGPSIDGVQWSPDGSQLAFLLSSSEGDVLYTIPATGGAPEELNRTNRGDSNEHILLAEWTVRRNDLVVNDDRDLGDLDPQDGVCDADDDPGVQCTLRAAIQTANLMADAHVRIEFDIPASQSQDGNYYIEVLEPLDEITRPVTIDGATQPGTETLPLVRIDGSQAGGSTSGFTVRSDDVTIRGLIITGFGRHGIHVASGNGSVLEGLIVGTDASGTAGIGNGGDGIHVSDATQLRIGSEEAVGKSSSMPLSVTLAGNQQNGLNARNEANASRMRAGKNVEAAAPAAVGLSVVNLVVGMIEAAHGSIPLPNGVHGISLEGVAEANLDLIRITDAVEDAVRIASSQSVTVRRALMGLRQTEPTSNEHVGSIGGSIFHVIASAAVTIGSENASDAPVQGGGAKGWFVEVEDARDVKVQNLLAGITGNVAQLNESMRETLRNLSGGMTVTDSPDVTVGAVGVPTVFANNGGDATKPQAGFLAKGSATRALRALNLHVGTTPEGLSGLGNLGDGFVISDGVREALLGGDSEDERIVSAGNGGLGYLFRNLTAAAQLPPDQQDGSVVTASGLVSDMVKAANNVLVQIANQSSGFRLEDVEAVRMSELSIGPAFQNGIEVIRSLGVELESLSVGMFWQSLVNSTADVAGPMGDGIVIENSEDVAIGRRLSDDHATTDYQVHVAGAGGRALYAHQSARTQIANLAAGLAFGGSVESEDVFDALGNDLEAVVIEESEDVEIDNAAFMSNGEHATSGGGGLVMSLCRRVNVIRSMIGEMVEERDVRRQNYHAAIKALQSEEIRVKLTRILGHSMGIEAEDSDITLEGNVISHQGAESGEGIGVHASGQSTVQATRNTVTDITGAGFWFTDGATGLIRHNGIEGNGEGVVVEASGNKSGLQTAQVLAPDNWWGDASGPGGAGSGSGDAISEGVEALTWLSGPPGVIVEPDARVVTGWAVTDVEVPVTFESPLFDADVLDVTITDERGWVTSEAAFELAVSATSGARRVIDVTLFHAGVNTVTIRAASRTNPELSGEAVVTIGSPRHFVSMDDAALAGSTVLAAEAEEVLVVGGEIVINPGGANEETATVAGFGSILVAEPLRFDHLAGEPIAPRNQFAVDAETGPAPAPAAATDLLVYPNPAAGKATLRLDLPQPGAARVELFDVVGRRVRLLQEGMLPAGRYEWQVDFSNLPSGVYLARIRTSDRTMARTLVVAR